MMIQPPAVKCVLFDAVGTLMNPQPSVAEVYQQIASRYGAVLSVSEIAQKFRNLMSVRPDNDRTSETVELQFWRETVRSIFGNMNEADRCFEEIHDHFARPSAWEVRDDVISTVDALRHHRILTAVASNFDGRLNLIVAGTPQLQGFDHLFISSEIGWRKPHPEFFNTILTTLQLSPAEVLMVGDNRELDILPARALGMSALHLVNRQNAADPIEADTISSLMDVLKWCRVNDGSH